uniref:FF domain-containing protein n=2 Tax=Kalmanozyma brasiliensis (strain GHG001) TaxID=1365824 RepID=V5EVC7_KALBG
MTGTPELNFKNDHAGAEAAFTNLLRETGVDVDWTWETTMRSIITNPLYKALKSIAERKAAFHKYVDELRRERAEESRRRVEQLKPGFKQLILGESRLKAYSSFDSAKKFLGGTAVWRQARGDEEAREVWETVMAEVREANKVEEERIRKRNMDMLLALLKTFEADVFTRWRDAHRTILESQEYTEDPHLSSMDLGDMLQVFEELMKTIEADSDAAKRRQLDAKRRKERHNRDAFKTLLRTLQGQGKIKPRSTWGEVLPLIKDDPDFLRVVGQPGSTPLDLFFDLVDELDQELERQTADALQHISASGHSVTPTTTEEDFLTWTTGVDVPADTLKQIYHELVSYLAEEQERKATDERRKLERKHRHSIEDLRYAFKKVEPPLDLDASWEDVKGRVEGLAEFKDAEKEDERVPRWAWDKFVRRQKEKEREMEEGRKRKERQESAGKEIETKVKRVRRDDEESEPEEGEV